MSPTAKWMFRNVGAMCEGKNFQESLPAVRKVIDTFVDPGMLAERTVSMTKTFNMSKGDSVEIPAGFFRGGDDLFIGLGWDCRGSLDLDASVHVVNRNNELMKTIYYGAFNPNPQPELCLPRR
jgi:hypothetical protein